MSTPPSTSGSDPVGDHFSGAVAVGETIVRVRYEESDTSGVGYHANSIIWFECARTELLRELGLPYRRLEELGWLLTVADVSARYLRPVRYDELLRVRCAITEATGARLRIEYRIHGQDGGLRTTGQTVLACLDASTWRPVRLAPALLEALASAGTR